MRAIGMTMVIFLVALPGCSGGEGQQFGGDGAGDAQDAGEGGSVDDGVYPADSDPYGDDGNWHLDGAADDGGDVGGDGGEGDEGGVEMPPDPSPFTLTISGAANQSIEFSVPTCVIYPVPSYTNFRHFWRGTNHNAVLLVEVLGSYTGPGTYDQSMNIVRARLQSEAGTPYNFFYQTDSSQGDTLRLTVEFADLVVGIWGEFTFSSMHDSSGGVITASPQPVPLWCPDVTY